MKPIYGCALALCLGLSFPLSAVTVTIAETLDLTKPAYFGPLGSQSIEQWSGLPDIAGPFSPDMSPFTLQIGDALDFTVTFLPGQQLTMQDLSYLALYSFATDGTNVGFNETNSLTLLNPDGSPLITSTTVTADNCCAHIGYQFEGWNFPGLPSTVTIGGLHYVGTLNSLDDPTMTSRSYKEPFLSIIFTPVAAPIPEPGTWASMAMGLAFLGLAMRRQVKRGAVPQKSASASSR